MLIILFYSTYILKLVISHCSSEISCNKIFINHFLSAILHLNDHYHHSECSFVTQYSFMLIIVHFSRVWLKKMFYCFSWFFLSFTLRMEMKFLYFITQWKNSYSNDKWQMLMLYRVEFGKFYIVYLIVNSNGFVALSSIQFEYSYMKCWDM